MWLTSTGTWWVGGKAPGSPHGPSHGLYQRGRLEGRVKHHLRGGVEWVGRRCLQRRVRQEHGHDQLPEVLHRQGLQDDRRRRTVVPTPLDVVE